MNDKKLNELDLEHLSKVTGGVNTGDSNIARCVECGLEFDLDSTTRGPDEIVKSTEGIGEEIYPTAFCPRCNENRRFDVIQVKNGDIKFSGAKAMT